MPNGEWSGWYFSEELKFAWENGYKIFVDKGYHFDKQDKVLDDYVNNLYKIKKKTTKKSNPLFQNLKGIKSNYFFFLEHI